MQTFLSSFIN